MKHLLILFISIYIVNQKVYSQPLLKPTSDVCLDTIFKKKYLKINELVGSGEKGYFFNFKNKYAGEIQFYTDSSFTIKNYEERIDFDYIVNATYIYSKGDLHLNGTYVNLSKKTGDTLLVEHYINGFLEDTSLSFYKKGKPKSLTVLKKSIANGPHLEWDSNGILVVKGAYKMDKYSGEWNFFHPTGKILASGKFLNESYRDTLYCPDECDFSKCKSVWTRRILRYSVKQGKWRYYNKNGILLFIESYNGNGFIRKTKFYSPLRQYKIIRINK